MVQLPEGGLRCPACNLCSWSAGSSTSQVGYVIHTTWEEAKRLNLQPAALSGGMGTQGLQGQMKDAELRDIQPDGPVHGDA